VRYALGDVSAQSSAPRVISLLPSATEIVYALGLGECLVGRSHECDFPAEAQSLPACTQPQMDSNAGSAEIDRQVKDRVARALSIYRVDLDQLKALRPDVILTQDQCGVCAVSRADLDQVLSGFPGNPPKLVSLAPQRLPEVWTSIQLVADILGAAERGKALLKALKNRVADVILRTAALKRRPTVACLEWIEPLMAAGNWVPELVDLAGGKALFAEAGNHSSWLAWDDLSRQNPDIVVVMPCGFDLERTAHEMPQLTRNPAWAQLRAVRDKRVALTDGSHYFNRPGPRLVESLEILVEILHPRLGQFGHAGRVWRPG